MYASTANMNMNMNAKGPSNLSKLEQRQHKAHADQESPKGKGKGVKLERTQMSAQFSKTEMCKFNILGICNKGRGCAFAHSENELKSRPDLSCTRLCRVFLQTGQCDDANCSFAHSKDQLRTTDFFNKTKICRFFKQGHCILDDKCRFAHTLGELKEDVTVKQTPQQQNLSGNNTNQVMAIPVMLNQIQFLLQQREELQQQLRSQSMQSAQKQEYQERPPVEIYSGCATPEYHDFDSARMQAICPATLQNKLKYASTNRNEQEIDRFQDNYWSNGGSNQLASPEPECIPCEDQQDQWDPSCSDSYGSSTPDFPPMYGEGQVPLKEMPPMQFHLPQLFAPVQQMNMTGNGTDAIDHYAGDVEIMQTPLSEEVPVPFNDINGTLDCNSGYQVKNTFISVKNTPYKPLRCVRSAAGRLTEIQNMM